MQTTLLSSKGQIIIPKALRDARHWRAGTRLQVQETSEGLLLKPIAGNEQEVPLAEGLAAIRKHIAYQGAAVSVDAMHAAILQEAARKGKR